MHLAGAVEVEDVPEDLGVAVEEVLLLPLVVEVVLLAAAQERLRELLERPAPRLEADAADVQRDDFVLNGFVLSERDWREVVRGDRYPACMKGQSSGS